MRSCLFGNYFSTSKSLLTWGEAANLWKPTDGSKAALPVLVDGFSNISEVSAGPRHLLFLTTDSKLYKMGSEAISLQRQQNQPQYLPCQKISKQNPLVQISSGTRHNLALAQDGTIFSWGFGGKIPFLNTFTSMFDRHSALGNKSKQTLNYPQPVQQVRQQATQIAAGKDFSVFVGKSGKVYACGSSLPKSLCCQSSSLFYPIDHINSFLEKQHSGIKKIRAVEYFLMLLLENGKLCVIGQNKGGVLGTRTNDKIVNDNWHQEVVTMVDQNYKGKKVKDFEVSSDSAIFCTEDDEIYYTGMFLNYHPVKFPIEKPAKTIFATNESVGIITHDDKVYFMNEKFIEDCDMIKGNLMVSDDPLLKNVVSIGGPYRYRYAIVA